VAKRRAPKNPTVHTPPDRRLEPIGRKAWRQADRRLDAITTAAKLRTAQKDLRKRFLASFGPLPDPAARVSARAGESFSYEGLTIQQVAVASAKGYEITGWTLRRRDQAGRRPALVVAAGHAEAASLHPPYLKLALYAARCGAWVFSFDPVGQGSRREVFRPDDHPIYWDPCRQHQQIGAITTIAGLSLPHFLASDCVTAVSFAAQQDEVDPARIGFAGQSGGGLQTWYAIGSDERIAAAVPSQATSTRREDFRRKGHRDMCQTALGVWEHGVDRHEMAALFAPRPVRILAEYGYHDSRTVYERLRPIYKAAGAADNIELCSGGPEHNLSRPCRQIVLGWLARHLDLPDALVVEPDWPGFDAMRKRLGDHVADVNAAGRGVVAWCTEHVRRSRPARPDARKAVAANPYLRGAMHNRSYAVTDSRGRKARKGAAGLRYVDFAEDYRIPFRQTKGRGPAAAALIVDADGMDSAWAKGWRRLLAAHARQVVATDVFECGRLATGVTPADVAHPYRRKNFALYERNRVAQDAFMAGRCPVGLAMEEMVAVLNSTGLRKAGELLLVGRGWPAVALLLLSARLPRVAGCCLAHLPESYDMLLRAGHAMLPYDFTVPGLAAQADLPDVIRSRPRTRYALYKPIVLERPSVGYDDAAAFPNVRLFNAETAGTRQAGLAFAAG